MSNWLQVVIKNGQFQVVYAPYLTINIYFSAILKVLSIEMEPAEKRMSIEKRELWVFLAKSARPPSCESHQKISRHLVQLLAIRTLIANANSAKKIHCSVE
jgi:hypothetical protein